MRTGIILVNPDLHVDHLSKQESVSIQKILAEKYIRNTGIHISHLNKNQINEYYTIPHALLYDLSKTSPQIDCFILYSYKSMDRFRCIYPEKWVELKKHFNEIVYLDSLNQHHMAWQSAQ
jgi:hypothetical protein